MIINNDNGNFDVFNEYKNWNYWTEELRGCLAGIIDVELNWLRKQWWRWKSDWMNNTLIE